MNENLDSAASERPAEHEASVAHTPGPWTADEHADSEDRGYLADDDSGHFNIRSAGPLAWVIAVTIGDVAVPKRDEKANARLIAAAPDLLEACDEALNVLIGCCVPAGGADDRKHILDAKAQLRAALAKARG